MDPYYDQQIEKIVNPDPVLAQSNLEKFLEDLDFLGVSYTPLPSSDDTRNGWHAFLLWYTINGKYALIHMPGVNLNDVRFMPGDGIDPFNYPRVRVDGNPKHWIGSLAVVGSKLSK